MSKTRHPILTIGHSTHSIPEFIALLRQHGIDVVVDVRSSPYSRFNPQFNRETLESNLKIQGIRYLFLGRELGARSEDPSCYENGRVKYERLAKTPLFQNGIDRVVRGTENYHIALMCAEKEPLECHRTLLVARALAALGLAVQHVLPDGSLESHEAAMERLLDLMKMPRQDLFYSKGELIAEALVKQEERVAYVDKKQPEAVAGEMP